MMDFNFDDYENLEDYIFTYPALGVLKSKYQKWLRKQKKGVTSRDYGEFIIKFVKDRITIGCRKFGEVEPEWETLLYYMNEVKKEFDADNSIASEKAVILYDQVLQLFYEGHPLPPNLL